MEWAAGAATGLIIGVGDSPENSEFLVITKKNRYFNMIPESRIWTPNVIYL